MTSLPHVPDYRESLLYRHCKDEAHYWEEVARIRRLKRGGLAPTFQARPVGELAQELPLDQPELLGELRRMVRLLEGVLEEKARFNWAIFQSQEFFQAFTDFLVRFEPELRPFFQELSKKPREKRRELAAAGDQESSQ